MNIWDFILGILIYGVVASVISYRLMPRLDSGSWAEEIVYHLMTFPTFAQIIEFAFRFWHWLPLLWNDCDEDSAFFYYVLQFKLLSMCGYFNNPHGHHYDPETSEEIFHALTIVNRVIADEYLLKCFPEIANAHDPSEILKDKSQRELAKPSLARQKDIEELFRILSKRLEAWTVKS